MNTACRSSSDSVTRDVGFASYTASSQDRQPFGGLSQAGTCGVAYLNKASPLSSVAGNPSLDAVAGRRSFAAHYAVDNDVLDGSQDSGRDRLAGGFCREDLGGHDSSRCELATDWRELGAAMAATVQLERSFVMDAVVGKVVCNSKGCRPIFPSSAPFSSQSTHDSQTSAFRSSIQGSDARTAEWPTRSSRCETDQQGCALPQFSTEFALFVDQTWLDTETAKKYFEAALQQSPFNLRLLTSYAEFSWKQLKDAKKAEMLYKRALLESPESAEVLASYALFLWQGE